MGIRHDLDLDPDPRSPSLGFEPSRLGVKLLGPFVALVRAQASEVRAWKQRANVRVLGAAGEGARDYTDRVWRGRVLLQLGCERGGLSDTQRALRDELVAIPMTGEVDSLKRCGRRPPLRSPAPARPVSAGL